MMYYSITVSSLDPRHRQADSCYHVRAGARGRAPLWRRRYMQIINTQPSCIVYYTVLLFIMYCICIMYCTSLHTALLACTGRSSSHHWLEEMGAARPDAACERALSGVVCKGVGWTFKPNQKNHRLRDQDLLSVTRNTGLAARPVRKPCRLDPSPVRYCTITIHVP